MWASGVGKTGSRKPETGWSEVLSALFATARSFEGSDGDSQNFPAFALAWFSRSQPRLQPGSE
jgi:hypothetical protein